MLKVEGIDTFYGKVQALRGVSLEIKDGEVVALLGANGAGKSTTLKTISGLLRPTAGSITLDGERLDRISPEAIARRGLVHVPEGRRIFPGLTVMENILIGASNRGRVRASTLRAEAADVLELFPGLKPFANRPGWTLSGGQQQMLAIARGIMGKPRVLMMDEPSLGLAPVLVQTVFDYIQKLHEQGTTILLVEQNAMMALGVAGRGYVLETGRVVLEDTADHLLHKEAIAEAYLGSAPRRA